MPVRRYLEYLRGRCPAGIDAQVLIRYQCSCWCLGVRHHVHEPPVKVNRMPAAPRSSVRQQLEQLLGQRILVLDGAMGTTVFALGIDEAAMRGSRLSNHHKDLKNFVDILCLTRPEAVTEIHRQYLEAGADIIETNTFGSSPIGMEEFDLPAETMREINLAAAACARRAADEFMARDPGRPRFVAGSIGPTAKTASMSPRVEDPGYRAVTFDSTWSRITSRWRR